MAKKTNGVQTSIPQGNIYVQPIEQVMPGSMLPYAEFVILDRALPRVEDGLKPVQRRILYTMFEMGLTPDKPHKKSARIVGDCMGKYHPHGDSSVYDAMVRMAQPFNMRQTLVNGHGNFGSVDGDPAAAMRYTEARLEPLALELLRDLDKETVPFSFNFDDSLLEPDILPGRYPNLLVNGANGIAVGLATNIPTHNLAEVIDGCCAYIDKPTISLSEIMKIIPGPDFSTGGYIIANELKQAYETGRGRITLRAKYAVEQAEYGKKNIVITELPYQTNKAELLRKIMLLCEEKKELGDGIANIVDESDRSGMRAVITLKKDADTDKILQLLFKYTDLECTFGINMVAIAGGKPRQLGLLDILKYYTRYQQQVVLRRCKFELKEAEARCHILEGLIIGVHNVDEVVKIIKTSENTTHARKRLMERFALTEKQAQAILDLRLARLAKLEVTKLEEEHRQLTIRIKELKQIIASRDLQFAIVKREMLEIKAKYKTERKTVIVGGAEKINVKREDVKRQVSAWTVAVTASNTIKFLDKAEFDETVKKKTSASANLSVLYRQVLHCGPKATALIFTNLGNCVKIPLDEVEPDDLRSAGAKLETLDGGIGKEEYPVKVFAVDGKIGGGELIFFTKQGAVKRSEWAEYDVAKRVFPALKLKEDDELINVETWDSDEYSTMLFVTKNAMCLNASKDDVPVHGRIAGGVRGVTVNDNDEVILATQHRSEGEIIVATSLGGFKRVISSLFDEHGRGSKGVMIADIKGKGELIFADYVTVPYKLAVVSGDKSVSEVDTEEINIENRISKGKPLANIKDAAKVVALKHKSEYPNGNVQIKF
ncbi:MAG: DNA topoisomerase 4 subunit A [Clostridiales bacterium]|nr:DNA topoisomerase 4 subunit A [Clostridiales bacterium]